jgi:PucR family transcriptional regulator, purine catabolism regulatory protein
MLYRAKMPLTVRDVLSLDAVQAGQPVVVAAADRLGTPVRWVHAAELTDVGRLLRGGELVLSTGIALPSSAGGLAEYVAGLAGAGVAGLAIELGQRYSGALPAALVTAAEARGVPLVAFQCEVPFVEITEAVHARIIDAQLAELRSAQRVHSVFTAQSVILADLSYRVLAAADLDDVPDGFAARARAACEGRPRTFRAEALLAPDTGCLVTMVGARGEDWGRLFLACPGPPAPEDTVLLERAATTLALGRLLARQAESVERQAHRTVISAIIEDGDPAAALARARAMGVPVTGRQLVALVARIPTAGPGLSAQALVLKVAEAVADACRDLRIPALVGSLDDVRVGALLSLPAQLDTDPVLRQLCARLADALGVRAGGHQATSGERAEVDGIPAPPAMPVIGVGSSAVGMAEARRSFLDAREVADVAVRHPDGRLFYRLPDLRLRGLLHMLCDDPRLTAFAERELGPLIAYDAVHGTRLARDLALYLEAGGNKAAAAARAHLARPTFYQRLQLIEHVLGIPLDSAESRTSLYVALLAMNPYAELAD